MKKCTSCEIDKEESEFYKKGKGFESLCKRCKREKAKENFDKNREENLAKDRLRANERRESEGYNEWRKEYERKNRKKISNYACEYYNKHKCKLVEAAKTWRSENKERHYELVKKSLQKFPLKRAARKFVSYAIAAKIIQRPNSCEKCLKECIPEAHHEDYSKPLDVKWLCRQCHGFIHRSILDGNSGRLYTYGYQKEGAEAYGFRICFCFIRGGFGSCNQYLLLARLSLCH